MSRRSPRCLTLNETQRAIRDAAVQRKSISVRKTSQGLLLSVEGNAKGLVPETPTPLIVVGCDVENYSGLLDWEQYYVGTLLPLHIRDALASAGINATTILGISGTGDGALVALKTVDSCQPILFVVNLWKNGVHCGFGRGLRVALGSGTCLEGQKFAGSPQMQGYGLVETARILSCDKLTHIMFSLSLWTSICGSNDLSTAIECGNATIFLQRSQKIFRGKFKPKDRRETAFVNCFGEVRDSSGSWTFGLEDETGLNHPGKDKTT